MPPVPSPLLPLGCLCLAASAPIFQGCQSAPKPEAPHAAAAFLAAAPRDLQVAPEPAAPPPGGVERIGGDFAATVTGADGDYRAGPCRVDTPLPIGYPAPTPPGAIDLKTYPAVRRAQVAGAGHPDRGMNRAFWPLFNHIKKHDIAMTSPVEMDYRGMSSAEEPAPRSWSMSFLYREPELNQTGADGQVVVADAEPVTVIAVGLKGSYSMSLVQRGMEQIEEWLAANPEWEADGDWRALYYNGPSLMWWNKWAEVQIPVRRALAPAAPSPIAEAEDRSER